MKKLLTLVLTALLMACAACGAALAERAEYASTQSFIDLMEEAGQPCVLDGLDEDGCEYVLLDSSGDPFDYTVVVFFDPQQTKASIRVWYIIEYAPERALEVMQVCNALNEQNRFLCFYADESDHTVTASMDLLFREDDAGRVTMEAVRRLTDALHGAWPMLRACTAPVSAASPTAAPAAAPKPTATPAPAATPKPAENVAGRTVIIAGDGVRLRSAPSASGSYVATAQEGERFECLGAASGWYAIDYHGRRAYVSVDRAVLE